MAPLHCDEDEERQAFLDRPEDDISLSEKTSQKSSAAWRKYVRVILEITMVLIIVWQCFRSLRMDKQSPLPTFPMKTYTFVENPRYLQEDMFKNRTETLHTLHNWIELSADGRGYVKVENADSFDLSPPYGIEMNATYTQPVYMMSVFHQLHCLSYLVQAFQTAFDDTELDQEVRHHSAHCFDYIRQSIMCAADTTLEGKTDAGPGWGSKHVCKDYEAVLSWANTHDVFKYRRIMPDEAVL